MKASISSKMSLVKTSKMSSATSRLLLALLAVVGLTLSPSPARGDCVPSPAGLLAWWRAEQDALDYVSTNHGVLQNGAGFASGQVGTAFSFDGVNDQIAFPGVGFNDLPTFGVWIKTTQTGGVILDGGAGVNFFETWRLHLDAQGRPVFQHGRNGVAGYVGVVGTNSVADGQFHYLAVTTDQEGKTLKLYVDGVGHASYTETHPAFTSWSYAEPGPSRLGAGNAAGLPAAVPFLGLLDEPELYDRALSAQEIAAIHAAGNAGKCVRRIEWFKIAGGGGESTNTTHRLRGTVGQHDAGGPFINSQYSLVGGFWALPGLVQTPGAPTLYITNAAPGFATLWWTPPTPGFTLQSTDSLSPTNWVSAPSGAANPVTVPSTPSARFYRLFKP